MEIPAGLDWLRTGSKGREWLERLPTLIEECSDSWSLRVGEPFAYAFASIALPAERDDGSQAVLKIQYPHDESEFEAAALKTWNGDGAVRLFEHAADGFAVAPWVLLFLERHLPHGPYRGQGGSQLVRGVGGESLELRERLLDPSEREVEDAGQMAELVVGVLDGKPGAQGVGRQGLRMPGHPIQGSERPPGQPMASQGGDGNRHG
jgi:hypothetical protein